MVTMDICRTICTCKMTFALNCVNYFRFKPTQHALMLCYVARLGAYSESFMVCFGV